MPLCHRIQLGYMRRCSRPELILVPVQPEDPFPGRRKLCTSGNCMQHLFFGGHTCEIQHVQLHPVHAEMHMRIGQTGQHMGSVPIDNVVFSAAKLQN